MHTSPLEIKPAQCTHLPRSHFLGALKRQFCLQQVETDRPGMCVCVCVCVYVLCTDSSGKTQYRLTNCFFDICRFPVLFILSLFCKKKKIVNIVDGPKHINIIFMRVYECSRQLSGLLMTTTHTSQCLKWMDWVLLIMNIGA